MQSELKATPPVVVKQEEPNKQTRKIKQLNPQKINKFKKVKRQRKSKKRWFKFFQKSKNDDYKIKNEWLRISVKILLWSLLIMVVSLVILLIGWTYPFTFVGSEFISTLFFYLFQVSLYAGLAALISTLFSLIGLAF